MLSASLARWEPDPLPLPCEPTRANPHPPLAGRPACSPAASLPSYKMWMPCRCPTGDQRADHARHCGFISQHQHRQRRGAGARHLPNHGAQGRQGAPRAAAGWGAKLQCGCWAGGGREACMPCCWLVPGSAGPCGICSAAAAVVALASTAAAGHAGLDPLAAVAATAAAKGARFWGRVAKQGGRLHVKLLLTPAPAPPLAAHLCSCPQKSGRRCGSSC